MHEKIERRRRDVLRDRLLADAWRALFPMWDPMPLPSRLVRWVRGTGVSFGLFYSSPAENDDERGPVGRRFGVLAVDSRSRVLVVGWSRIDRRDLLRVANQGRALRVRVFGWLRIDDDVDSALAAQTLHSVRVVGTSRIPPDVRQCLSSAA